MQLGVFSLSLPVKDLEASKQFYEKLGFSTLGGDASHGWLILKNGDTVIGLFKGMFEKNMLTFNGREHDGTCKLHGRGSGREPDPGRSAPVSAARIRISEIRTCV